MRRFLWVALVVALGAAMVPAAADVMPPNYRLEPAFRGLTSPQAVAFAPDGRIFYLERVVGAAAPYKGTVRVIQNGRLVADPFVSVDVAQIGAGSEEGMLGIALDPRFPENGYVYLYYTQASPRTNRLVRYTALGNVGTSPTVVLDNLGAAPAGLDNGGGLVFGADGKLYVGVGTMENDAMGQDPASFLGKILRVEDLNSATVYALGFRDPLHLAVNRAAGTVYAADTYEGDAACDEVDVVRSGLDYGWSVDACAGTGPGHEPPMHALTPQLAHHALTSYPDAAYPLTNNLFVAGASGKIVRDNLGGAAFDTLVESSDFYVPSGSCPTHLHDLEPGRDGLLWAVSDDPGATAKGLYRVVYDEYGKAAAKPREVSSSAHLQLMLSKEGAGMKVWWEDLKREAWGCSPGHCPAGSKSTKYSVWSGPLTSPFAYGHTLQVDTDGTDEGDALQSWTQATAPSGSAYYLVSARSSNYEGTLGVKREPAGPTERPGFTAPDLCTTIGYGTAAADLNKCVGTLAHTYPDQNNKSWNLDDFRGKAIFLTFMQYG